MKLNELEVLQLLKDGLIGAADAKGLKLSDKDFGPARLSNSPKKEYYLSDYRNNLYEKPLPQTELGTGVDAVRSSAAMIFNVLGNNGIVLDGKNTDNILYEKTFEALLNREPAHLDAVILTSDGTEMYAIEAKLLEWISSPKNLAKAYLDKAIYPSANKESQLFIDFFQSLVYQKEDKEGKLMHKTRKYDAIQMTIHTLGLYNHFVQNSATGIKRLTLLNVVWKYDCDEYAMEETEARAYITKANERFAPIFKELGIDFSVEYSSFQDFKKRIDFSDDPKRSDYLKRYEL